MNNIKKNVLLSATALGLVFAFNANAEIKVQTGDTDITDDVISAVVANAKLDKVEEAPAVDDPESHMSDGTYAYTKADGSDGEGTDLEVTTPESYKGIASSADGTTVKTDKTLGFDSGVLAKADYDYKDGQGNWTTYGSGEKTFNDTYQLGEYAAFEELTLTGVNGGSTYDLDGKKYQFGVGATQYTLNSDATKVIKVSDGTETLIDDLPDGDLKTAATAAAREYANAKSEIQAKQNVIDGYATQEATNYAAAGATLANDQTTVNNLKEYEESYENAQKSYNDDKTAYDKYLAYKSYDNSLSQAIDTKAYDAIDEVVGHANTAEEGEESNATGLFKADETLQANIDAEATARSEADEALQANIDAEVTARSEADETLQANIDAEATARSEADETLQANIDAEVTRATAAESKLDTAIKAETTRATTAESELDTAIKAEATRATGVENAINAKIGEGFDAENTVAMAIGDRTNLGSGNTAINDGVKTSVAAGLRAAGDAIGDVDFSKTNYAMGATDLSSAIRQLDASMAETQAHNEARFDAIDHRISSLRKEMREGLAATAALAGLVPLDNTYKSQLSMAMGGYENKQAVALGGFHYLKENIILNAGVSYGGSHSTAYKVGVTFGF